MTRDKANLTGKVTVNDITETARQYVPEMREKGRMLWSLSPTRASLPIRTGDGGKLGLLPERSAGRGRDPLRPRSCGLPGKDFASIKGADIDKGTLNGVRR